jgi:hypothetical protein
MTPPDLDGPPDVDEHLADDFPTVVALPVYQPEVPGVRAYSRAELQELLYEQTRLAVQSVAEAAAAMGRSGDALDRAVKAARSAGASWADIGRAAGITRQSAQARWGS